MKFSVLMTLLPLFLSSSIAYAGTIREVIQARQVHVKKSLVDVCTALDSDVQFAPGGQNMAAGHLNTCLCVSAVPAFLESNPVAKKVVDGLGKDGAHEFFSGLIQNQKDKQECHYPSHASPSCSIKAPCDFTCGDGYAPSPATGPTECGCKPPLSECNGKCGNFPQGCSSQGPTKGKRDSPSWKRDTPTCATGKTICGVPNGGSGYDCVDIKGDPESCGGCTVASPFGGSGAGGKNCKDLPHVDSVTCDGGACKILSCKDGLKVSAAGDQCVNPSIRRRQARGVEVIDEVLNQLASKQLLVQGFNIAAAKQQLLLTVKVLDYDHILQALLAEGAIVGIKDLAKLKEVLGLGASIHRRDVTDIDSLFALIISKGLFVSGFDIAAAKANLIATLGGFDVRRALEALLSQNAFIVHDLATLRDRLGLNFAILRREVARFANIL